MFGSEKRKKKWKAERENIPAAMDWILENLKAMGTSSEDRIRAQLRFEDVLDSLIHYSAKDAYFTLVIAKHFGRTELSVSCRGNTFTPEGLNDYIVEGVEDSETRDEILTVVNKVLKSNFSFSYNNGINYCTLRIAESSQRMLYMVLAGLFGGVLFGVLGKVAFPAELNEILSNYLLGPVNTMFMHALKFLICPLIFFSIAKSIADYSDLRSLGRVAGKVVGGYLFTSVVAIAVGFLVYHIFQIGDPALASSVGVTDYAQKAANTSISLKDVIINIIPSDIITPVQNMDMLSVIFMGLLLGLSASLLQDTAPFCSRIISDMNELFSKAISLVMEFMPFVIFCSMAKMIMVCNLESIVRLIIWLPVVYIGCIAMMCFYLLLLAVVGRINPFKIFKGAMPILLTAFSTGSSAVTMPVTLNTCRDNLKIQPKIYSFSIPLGSTMNMDGTAVTLAITGMFMAKVFGVDITPDMIVQMIITILVLSIGAPGVPGACLLCMAILFPVINVPPEAVSILIGIYPLVGRALTTSNVTGDVVITTIVAKTENAIALYKSEM